MCRDHPRKDVPWKHAQQTCGISGGKQPMNGPRQASVAFILVSILLSTLGVGIIIPVLPRLVTSFAGGDLVSGSLYYGAFVSVYAAMQFVFAPIIGGLSDRYGRRTVLLTSQIGAALDYVLLTFAPDLSWLFIGRVIGGITGASFSTAAAYVADVTPPDKRAQSFGLMGAAFGLGFIIGPALGGLLGDFNPRWPFAGAAALNIFNACYGWFVLPESLAVEQRRPFSLARSNPFGSFGNLRKHPVVLGLTGTLLCSFLAQQMLQSIWALSWQGRLDWRPMDVGASLAAVGTMGALVQGGLIRVVVPRLGERGTMMAALSASIAGFCAFGSVAESWMVYAVIPIFALGGMAGPAAQALISREVSPSEQGQMQGSLTSLNSLAAIVAPLIATSLFAHFSPADATPHLPGAPFFAAAFCNVVALVIAIRLARRLP